MKSDSGRTTSVWMQTSQPPRGAGLTEDEGADVCIVGAGIAGLATAYLLAREGRRVVVLEDGAIGGGETGRTTAHLTAALDDRYYRLEQLHGEKGARLAAESHTLAVDRIETIVREEAIDCAFERVDGYLFVPQGDADELDRELAAARRAGLAGLEIVARAPIPSFDTGRALRFPRQAQFHPLDYLNALARAVTARGGRVVTGAHVAEVHGGPRARVVTDGGRTVTAGAVVVATNTPVNDRLAIHTKQAPYRTYVVGLKVATGAIPHALFWDTPDPYYYVRLQTVGDHDVLIVGGEDHKTGQAVDMDARWSRLEAWARERFPEAGAREYWWSGQVMEPVDGLAYIGRNPLDSPNVFVATGDSGNGMTHGTIAGILLADLIAGRANPWATLYDPGRVTLRAAKDFARENLNVAAQYKDLVTGGESGGVEGIAPGTGAVLRRGIHKVACSRDSSGKLTELSAVCTHLGCIVGWNAGEKTWDCPCHGSRFAPDGHVVNGPAITPLGPAPKE